MTYRKLGSTGMDVSLVGYGAWGIGGKQWLGGDDDESLKALRRAMELGLNLIDTALAYGDGHSEQLVGKAVKEAPGRVYIATKVPPKNRLWPARAGIGIDAVFPYRYIVESTEESLRNLGVETIDLQQLHVWNPEWLASDEWPRAFEDLKKQGKVRHWGVSLNDHAPETGLGIAATGLIDSVQVIYNIFDQSPEEKLFPMCRERGVGVLARCPFDEGALTGSVGEDTQFAPGEFREWYFRGDRKRQIVEHVAPLEREVAELGRPLAEVALWWCADHPAVSTVIPGMRRVRNAESNCGVGKLGPFPALMRERLKQYAWGKNFYQ